MSALGRILSGLFILAYTLPAEVCAREQITVFAAASLKDALETAAKPFTASTGTPVGFNFAASSTLARQIEQGASANLFASADLYWMDYLAHRNLIRPNTRVNLLSNKLVVIAPTSFYVVDFKLDNASVKAALGRNGRLATGEVSSVPVGKYAKAALENLRLWDEVRSRLAPTDDVRTALNLVAGELAPLGIVYATDAGIEPRVEVVATFPTNSHPPIIYPFALTAATQNDGAAKFLDYLRSDAARHVFEAHWFRLLAPESRGVR
jgi:molybdate transport system substrate-binding protein